MIGVRQVLIDFVDRRRRTIFIAFGRAAKRSDGHAERHEQLYQTSRDRPVARDDDGRAGPEQDARLTKRERIPAAEGVLRCYRFGQTPGGCEHARQKVLRTRVGVDGARVAHRDAALVAMRPQIRPVVTRVSSAVEDDELELCRREQVFDTRLPERDVGKFNECGIARAPTSDSTLSGSQPTGADAGRRDVQGRWRGWKRRRWFDQMVRGAMVGKIAKSRGTKQWMIRDRDLHSLCVARKPARASTARREQARGLHLMAYCVPASLRDKFVTAVKHPPSIDTNYRFPILPGSLHVGRAPPVHPRRVSEIGFSGVKPLM